MLYEFFQALIFLMFLCTLISVFALIDNYTAGNVDEHDDELQDHWAMSGSIAAHGKSGEPSSV